MTLDFCGRRPPQLVVAEGNKIFEVTETHIRGRGPPYLLVAGATRLSKSHVPKNIGTYGQLNQRVSYVEVIT